MLDPANDLLPPPSSPTNSSLSSSDLDTESTGSFFHDRSTTLGTLMGVTFPALTFRAPSQRRRETLTSTSAAPRRNRTARSRASTSSAAVETRRRWWSLCRDAADARPSSLGDFLAVERRFGDIEFYGAAAELEEEAGSRRRNGGGLFADGRVLPPAIDLDNTTPSSSPSTLCRFPVSLTAICNGCVR